MIRAIPAVLVAAALGADRLVPYGFVGFSMGADAALSLIDAHVSPPAGLRAAAAYYPSCEDHAGPVTVPLAIFDGDADTVTPPAPCAALVHAAVSAGKPATITTYPGATHGFDAPGPDRTFYGQRIHFDAAAATDAAVQTLHLLERYLGN